MQIIRNNLGQFVKGTESLKYWLGKKRSPLSQETKIKIGNANRGLQIKFKCEMCKKDCEIREWNYKQNKNHFCSQKCYSKFQKINPVRYWLGKKRLDMIGHKWNVGKKRTEEEKKERSLSQMGEKHWNWKGGYKNELWQKRQRRIRELGSEGFHTLAEWETLKANYNWICPSCYRKEPEIKLTTDHIVPLIKGGSHNIENIQPLCKSCNSKKYIKVIKYEIKIC